MDRLASFFQIRPNEGRMVALLTALMFFPSAGGSVGSPSIESLFYTRFGVEYLPYMYIVLGAITVLITFLITAAMGRLSRKGLYRTFPALFALTLVCSRIMVGFDLNWFYPFLWLEMYILWTLQNLMTWGTASMVCDTRQAKRLFPLFSAGGILGTAIGGLVTKSLVRWIGTENLLLVWAGTLVITFVLISILTRDVRETRINYVRQRTPLFSGFGRGYQYVRNSKLMRRISLTALLLGLLFFMLAFPFSREAASQIPDEDRLAGFLGIFYGLTTVVTLLVSLFLANRLFARYGFMVAVLCLPVIYLLGFTSITIHVSFPMLITFRFLQMSWLQGVSGTAYEAVFSIVPSERREQSRMFIKGVHRQIGVMLAGLLLVISQQTMQPRFIFVIGIVAAAIATFFIWMAKKAYGGALVDALRAGHPAVFFAEEEPFRGFKKDATAVSTVLAGVSDPDPQVRRIAAEILGNLSLPEATEALVKALDDSDIEVRVSLLRSLERANAARAILEVSSCLEDPEPEVRLQSIKTLTALAAYPKGLISHVEPLLDDTDPRVRITAASTIQSLESHSKAFSVIEGMIHSGKPDLQILALEAFADLGGGASYDLTEPCLSDSNTAVRKAALVAVTRIDPGRSLNILIKALGDEDLSVMETAVSEVWKAGSEAFPHLIEALSDPGLEAGALKALESFPLRREVELIRQYARVKVTKMHQYEEMRHQAEQQNHDKKYNRLLLESLRDYARFQGINALKAVGLIKHSDSVALAIDGLNSDDTEQRANALEMLDSIGEREIVGQVLKQWESPSAGVEKKKVPDGQDQASWMIRLLQDTDAWLRSCAAITAADSQKPQLREALQRLTSDPDALVREIALKSLEEGVDMKTLNTISLMDRIIFLRRVPMFSRLRPTELKQISAICVEEDFIDGEIITREGEPGEKMYIIVSGEVRVMAGETRGKSVELARRQSGEYVGEMAIISKEPRMATLIASGNVRTLCISQKQFEQILRQRPETSLAVMRVLCARLRETQSL